MLYLAFGLSISLSNICNPFSCLFQIFSWSEANEVLMQDTGNERHVPETVEQMRELIKEIKADQHPNDPLGDALKELIAPQKVHECDE